MNLISVVIPAYNAEKTIKECLLSIKNQTHKNLEIILVDDDSIDNTIKVANLFYMEFKDELDMTIIKLDENSGPGAARNKGIELSKGRYITFVDSDDVINPLFCEVFLDEIVKNKADLVTSKNFRFKDEYDFPNVSKAKFKLMEDPVLFIKKSGTSACATLYKKSSINLRFPERMTGEDDVFTSLYLSTPRKIIFTEEAFYGYRLAVSTSITSSSLELRAEDLEKKINILNKNCCEERVKTYVSIISLFSLTRTMGADTVFISKQIEKYINKEQLKFLLDVNNITIDVIESYLNAKESKYAKSIYYYLKTQNQLFLTPFYISSIAKKLKKIL